MAAMFDDVAPTYDRLNTLMTLGSDVRWRRRAVEETHARLGDAVIDVCCGTGKLAAQVAERVGPFGRVEGVDLSDGMIRLATQHFHSLVQAHFGVANAAIERVGVADRVVAVQVEVEAGDVHGAVD